jgi:D-alanine-D-alanine ligase
MCVKKINVCVLFGGISSEHEVSLRSAESVLEHMDTEKYNIFPVGITKSGEWFLLGGEDYSQLPSDQWMENSNNRKVAISPVRGQGLLIFEDDRVRCERIDVVFPVLHGENGEDGAMQGLLQIAGIPYVGPHVAESAVSMDKTLTKLVMDHAGIPQADWRMVKNSELPNRCDAILAELEEAFSYPVFVKPAGTGSSVGVSKAKDRAELKKALEAAGVYGEKILVEECINGKEIEVAVMGNRNPVASVCGEIDSGAEFYDYDAKYVTDSSVAYIPARIPEAVAEQVRELAVKAYTAAGCQGLSRVDFFVTHEDERIILNEINTIPGFTSISMFPKLFVASGIPYPQLIDELLQLAMEVEK